MNRLIAEIGAIATIEVRMKAGLTHCSRCGFDTVPHTLQKKGKPMPLLRWKTVLATALCAAVYSQPGLAQVAPPTILVVNVENLVQYREDTSDVSKFADDPNPTTPSTPKNFNFQVVLGDIVAVNGQPAKGTLTRNARLFNLSTAPNPGQAIADTVRGGVNADTFEILNSDGTSVGTIVSYGLAAGSPPPGAPLSITLGNFAITGGTGAFLGARGQVGRGVAFTDYYYPAVGFGDGGPREPPSQWRRAEQVCAPGDPDVSAANCDILPVDRLYSMQTSHQSRRQSPLRPASC